ncbi:methyltransferase family protein [Nocardiopsis sp. Huas11]|uniref:class I SAM-dependent DNA methyltransferase n=1 Tax=Nocardiopsis sp. Huas11 TaxID=2183912 RepID=UPI000EB206B5|nr:class I SAM-dependent methyltransferase [Nocardiopsis sp. Huas11]RKS08985.1 methyltransferase family protein [Nocardiopsis sp. Huas11]
MTPPDFLAEARTFYDAFAATYTDRFRDALDAMPMDRAMLGMFAELVRSEGGQVADLGCGSGRVTAYLRDLGLPVFGIDLSPAMVELARREHPGLRFEVGSILDLDLPDGSVGGALAYYSIIHMPPEHLPGAFAEFHRVLAPGGHLMLAFQVGDEPLYLERPLGHEVSLDFQRLRPDDVADLLTDAGLSVRVRAVREPDPGEGVPQAYLLARRM